MINFILIFFEALGTTMSIFILLAMIVVLFESVIDWFKHVIEKIID